MRDDEKRIIAISHLYGVYYAVGSEKFGSIEIKDASSEQIQERIEMIEEGIGRMEKARLDPSNKHRPGVLDGFLEDLRQEVEQLKRLV